ncbi:hypothetical protein TNCV_3817191 [Trichonephila clavipes]|nr:hypothetical protein TNCV_3817191 [Trichonephila clavipes]
MRQFCPSDDWCFAGRRAICRHLFGDLHIRAEKDFLRECRIILFFALYVRCYYTDFAMEEKVQTATPTAASVQERLSLYLQLLLVEVKISLIAEVPIEGIKYRYRHALLAKDLVTWQAMVGRHFILEDIVGRVAQYFDEHYPVDKWHMGDFNSMGSTIGVKISSTYLRAVSKCLEGLKDDRVSQEIAPQFTVTPLKLLYAARQ